eukprot:9704867-Alexandrium_andersonii.AAC.2
MRHARAAGDCLQPGAHGAGRDPPAAPILLYGNAYRDDRPGQHAYAMGRSLTLHSQRRNRE